MTTREKAVQEWQHWAEQEIGGSQERIVVCVQAAIAALDLHKNTDDVIAAARKAAAQWDSQHQPLEPDSNQTLYQWHRWVEQQIGGSPGRIGVATQAADAAIAQRKSEKDIIAAARGAAAAWESRQAQTASRRLGLKVFIGLVAMILTVVLVSQLRYPLVIIRKEGSALGILALIDILVVIVFIRLFRR
jgi:hypothetical protein